MRGETIVDELLVMFTTSIRQHLSEMNTALSAGELAQRAVHNIKGISGAIYSRQLHHHATIVDRSLKAGGIEPESIQTLHDSAEAFLAEINPTTSAQDRQDRAGRCAPPSA